MITDIDIIRWANMPKFSQYQTDYILSTEAFSTINEFVDYITNSFDQIHTLSNAYQKISRHGITSYIVDEFSDVLAPYSINFRTQSPSACMEGLSSLVERLWTAIKNALSRLLEFLKTNPYFAQWFNRCEYYRAKMAALMAGPLKNYIKADLESFNSIVLTGLSYADFFKYTNLTGILISKLKCVGSYKAEDIDIIRMFYEIFNNGLTADFIDNVVSIKNPVLKRDTTKELGWTPQLVNTITNNLYSKVAVNAMCLTRLTRDIERQLNIAIVECNNVLAGREDGNDDAKVVSARNRIRNIKNIQNLVQLAVNYTCFLCAQWCKMASSFDKDKRPYPIKPEKNQYPYPAQYSPS